MEVFVTFSGNEDEAYILQQTLEAWAELEDCEPSVVTSVADSRFELRTRAAANGLATTRFFVVADAGTVPADEHFLVNAKAKTAKMKADLAWAGKVGGVSIIRKRDNFRWPIERTVVWDDIAYKHLQEC